MSEVRITFAYADDGWEAMYIDGKKVAEDHSLDAKVVVDVLIKESLLENTIRDESVQIPQEIVDDGFVPDRLRDFA